MEENKKKFLLVSPKNRTVYNFRGDLIKKIVASGYEVIVTGPNEDHIEKIKELGAKFVKVPMNKNGINPFADIRYCRKLKRIFKTEKPDIVLAYTSKPVIYSALAGRKIKSTKIYSMITGIGYAFTAKSFKAKLIRMIMCRLYKQAFKRVNGIIFQNKDDLFIFQQLGLVKNKDCKVVNGSGVNMSRFHVCPFPEVITFLMIARALRSKGVLEYLQACEFVKKKYPFVRCIYLGACEKMPDCIDFENIQKYVDSGIIEYFGETERVEDYYSQCSVFVLPSYHEGVPRTVLEAMSMGRPIVTTDVPGCRETVIDGENGFMAESRNPQSLADAMCRFLDAPELIQRMGEKSLELCRGKFDIHKVNKTMCEYLSIKE